MKRENGKDDPSYSEGDLSYSIDNPGYSKDDPGHIKDSVDRGKDSPSYPKYNTVSHIEKLWNENGENGYLSSNKDNSSSIADDLGVQIVTPYATIKEFDIYEIHNYTLQGLKSDLKKQIIFDGKKFSANLINN
jgi:hypothetical protein